MADRTRALLVASLVLNLFLIGAGIGGAIYGQRLLHDRLAGRPPSLIAAAAKDLPPEVRARLREHMRSRALAVRPDFVAARAARAQAVELASAPKFDRAAVSAKLDEARTDETRARASLDAALLDFMQTLGSADRVHLAPVLRAHRPHSHGGPGHEGPAQAGGPH